jgi:hypothetical protein
VDAFAAVHGIISMLDKQPMKEGYSIELSYMLIKLWAALLKCVLMQVSGWRRVEEMASILYPYLEVRFRGS